MPTLMFLHGMESSPLGTKSQFIKSHYPDSLIPELSPDIHERKSVIEKIVKKSVRIVGSSLGGLSALLYAMSFPERVEGMILIAPAVGFFDQTVFNENDKALIRQTCIPAGIPCTVMIGKKDDVIPQADIEAMIARSPDQGIIKVIKQDDDHTLNQSLDLLLMEIKEMMARD
ncbi:MAG: alpha/beta fold hydrolase [Deltaproteobacteria bacterium]|nr:alpha/beta fold hydrolase [Deltaproteobacteria bacterium]